MLSPYQVISSLAVILIIAAGETFAASNGTFGVEAQLTKNNPVNTQRIDVLKYFFLINL